MPAASRRAGQLPELQRPGHARRAAAAARPGWKETARSQRQPRPGLALVDLDAVRRSGAGRRRHPFRPALDGAGQPQADRWWPPPRCAGGLQAHSACWDHDGSLVAPARCAGISPDTALDRTGQAWPARWCRLSPSTAACRRDRACRNALSITPDRAGGACPARAWQRHPPLLPALRTVGPFCMASRLPPLWTVRKVPSAWRPISLPQPKPAAQDRCALLLCSRPRPRHGGLTAHGT